MPSPRLSRPFPQWARCALLGIGLAACGGGDPPPAGPDPDPDDYDYPVGKVFFSHLPIGLDGVFFYEGMGALYTPFQEDHGGFHHFEVDAAATTIPVIAPAAGQILHIRTHVGTRTDPEYAVQLKVSTTIHLLWGHVGRLSEKLAAQAGPLGATRDVRIPVEAGEILGYVGFTALDLAVNDSSRAAPILHPEFYGPNAYAVPLEDYYQGPLRTQLLDLTLREVPPRTGHMGFDVAGTLSGLWYAEGSDPRGPEFRSDIAVHFGYHHLQAHRSEFFDGLSWEDRDIRPDGRWAAWIKGNPRLEQITPADGLQKWELFPSRYGIAGSWPDDIWLEDVSDIDDRSPTRTILLVEMLDEDTIRLERFEAPPGGTIDPATVTGFTAAARTYHRNPVE
jgi:hypothetical protein